MRAQFVFHEVWIGLRRNLTMTIALIVVVAISLSLLGTGLLFVKQVDQARSNVIDAHRDCLSGRTALPERQWHLLEG